MTQTDILPDETEPMPRQRPAALRLMLWAMLVLCGGLMAAVLLSDPRIAARVETATAPLTARVQALLPETSGDGAPAARIARPVPVETTRAAPKAEPAPRPAVLGMPSDRVPVRRAGQPSGN